MMRTLLIAFLLAGLPLRAAAAPVKVDHVEAELIAEQDALVPGGDNWLALRLKPDEGWHVYWQNPGDSGLPTQLLWQAVDGAEAGDLQWPYPEIHALGDLTNYGYGQETLHLLPLRVTAAPGASLALRAQAKWLVCKDVCIPGSAQLALDLPVRASAQADGRWQAAFTDMRTRLPRMAPQWSARFAVNAQDFSLQVDGPGLDETARFFPLAGDLVAHSTPQRLRVQDGSLRLTQTLSPYFVDAPAAVDGVLVLGPAAQARAFRISAAPGDVTALPALTTPAPTSSIAKPGLALVLLFAVLGGLILNLMPCVFPVLSLKALALMQAREHGAREQRRHALAYTAGVMLSCGAVAALLLGLRAGGEALGWGFQLQSPVFVGLLAYLMFLLGLSLSGALEIGARWMGVGQSLTQGHSARSSFFTGVLATVVASPCTAPFMGTALGYALTQSAFISLSIFLALGFGLALPFLLLGFAPRLAALLPRPGAWMETFKQLMAFPLYLTAVWLLWVLTRQAGANAGALLLCGAVLITFAVWLWRRPGVFSRALRYVALAGALALLAHPALRANSTPTIADVGTEAYSDARFEQLRAEGRTVFVNLTADWCITCKVNERAVIDTERMHAAFAERGVVHLVGDWTRSDPALTAVLERYGRSGVPLYLVSVAGGEPQVLPQILTSDLLLDSLTP